MLGGGHRYGIVGFVKTVPSVYNSFNENNPSIPECTGNLGNRFQETLGIIQAVSIFLAEIHTEYSVYCILQNTVFT